jgi:hypothetical protein
VHVVRLPPLVLCLVPLLACNIELGCTSRQPVFEELPLPVVEDVDRLWSRRRVLRVARKYRDGDSHREKIVIFDSVELRRHVRLLFRGRPNDWRVVRGENLVVNAGDPDAFTGEAGDHNFEYLEDGVVLRGSALWLVSVVRFPFIEFVGGERV